MSTGGSAERCGIGDDPLWFKKAVFYEVWVRSFADTTGTGVGDLNGLVSKFDYLAWLGIDCIWIPPFFSSPERDGGYDVERLTGIQVQLGTHGGLKTLIEERTPVGFASSRIS